jgi:hypothetical protein
MSAKTVLVEHMAAVEQELLSRSRIQDHAGHPLHKGTPREAFIRGFLESHLSNRVAVGTGEIIDADSETGQPRPQADVVIYKRDYPKLDLGGGIDAFLVESVVATIEVKSTLDEPAIQQSLRAARQVKALQRHTVQPLRSGYQPPGVLCYVVAYDGPARMRTVHGWIRRTHESEGIPCSPMPPRLASRIKVISPTIDAVFVLGKGFVHFDNVPLSLVQDPVREKHPTHQWVIADTQTGSLLLLFAWLTTSVSNLAASWLNPVPYLRGFSIPGQDVGFQS